MVRKSLVVTLLLWALFTTVALGQGVELEFWFGHSETNVFAQRLAEKIEEFNQTNPHGIQVNVHFSSGSGSYMDRLITAHAGGVAPDVAHMWTYNLQPLAVQNLLLDVYKVVDPSEVRRVADLAPGALDMVSYKGGLYGLPISANTYGLIYNAEDFAKAGLGGPPETVQELDEYAHLLTRVNGDGNIVHMGYYPNDISRLYWGWVFGGEYYDNDAGRYTLDHPGVVEALEWSVSYIDRYGLDAINTFHGLLGSPAQGKGPLISGNFSIISIGQYRIPTLRRLAPDTDWGFAPLPSTPDGPKNATLIEADVVAIMNSTEHPREAAQFLLWFGSSETLASLIQQYNLLIPHNGVSPDLYHPDYQMWIKLAQSSNARAVPFTEVAPQFSTVFGDAINKAQNGEMTAIGALSEANDILNSLLEEARQR